MDMADSVKSVSENSDVSPVNNIGKWPLARKLWYIVGLMVSILSISGVVAYVQIQTIKRSVLQVTEVEEPLEEAVLEMEINAGMNGFMEKPIQAKKLRAAISRVASTLKPELEISS